MVVLKFYHILCARRKSGVRRFAMEWTDIQITVPKRYADTAANGHFGRPGLPWERTDMAAALREAVL